MRPIVIFLILATFLTIVSCQNYKKNNRSNDRKYKSNQSNIRKLTPTKTTTKPLPKGHGAASGGNNWKTIKTENSINQNSYKYGYKTENGITAEEIGKLENVGTINEQLKMIGFFEYTGDDGLLYRVDYVADSNGFTPRGDHIPKPHPSTIKMLRYLATQQSARKV